MTAIPPLQVRLFWAGVALVAGLGLLSYCPHLPRDVYPLASTLCLVAGLLLRLRTGPLLFLGMWIAGELRPLLPSQAEQHWRGLPGSLEAGSPVLPALLAVTYVLAACQYQFLSAGVHLVRTEPFVHTLADPSPRGPLLRTLAALLVRALWACLVAGVFLAGAEWASETEIGYVLQAAARTGALFWQAALLFMIVSLALDAVRFFTLDRTSAACYVNDLVWHSHRKYWAAVDRRTPS